MPRGSPRRVAGRMSVAMPLVDHAAFGEVVEHFRGLRIGFLPLPGNVGDRLIDLGARQLFDSWEIDYRQLDWRRLFDARHMSRVEAIVVSGGGNLGPAYPEPVELRELALETGRPLYILPQSITGPGEDLSRYAGVWARERYSLQFAGVTGLGPDTALAVDYPWDPGSPRFALGVFLRTNQEGLFVDDARSVVDPVRCCETVDQYMGLAATCAHVITDRLHFAVAALLIGREATLLPNSYHKNRGMYESWLAELGCGWRDDLHGIDFDPVPVRHALGEQVAGYESRRIDWSARPAAMTGIRAAGGEAVVFQDAEGEILARPDDTSLRIWSLMDGQRSFRDLAREITDDRLPAGEAAASVDRFAREYWNKGLLTPYDNPVARSVRRRPGMRVLTIQSPREVGGRLRLCATLATDVVDVGELWFEVDGRLRDRLVGTADPFVLACLYGCMASGDDLWVRGAPVSASLLYNLREYQRAWHCWNSDLAVISIVGETLDDSADSQEQRAISCFSGGLDSCETVYRHAIIGEEPARFRMDTALVVRGFDIPWEDRATWRVALERIRRFMPIEGVALEEMTTNLRDFNRQWPEAHGLAAAACLTLLSRGCSHGLIPSTFAYNAMMPWGSNPLTDSWMGRDGFTIVHDGAHLNRLDKMRHLASWPEALTNLRVCWQEGHRATNCGTCVKCVMTGLMARVAGADASFLGPGFTDEAIDDALAADSINRADWMDARVLFREASRLGIYAPWVARLAALRPA